MVLCSHDVIKKMIFISDQQGKMQQKLSDFMNAVREKRNKDTSDTGERAQNTADTGERAQNTADTGEPAGTTGDTDEPMIIEESDTNGEK